MAPAPDPFWSKVDMSGDCWTWRGEHNRGGYARAWVDGRRTVAHVVAYQRLVGPVPEGRQLDHLCRNRGCVNPAHLDPVTAQENTLRGEGPGGRHARQTHCKRGHEFDIIRARGGRDCRTCQREANRRYEARVRAPKVASLIVDRA